MALRQELTKARNDAINASDEEVAKHIWNNICECFRNVSGYDLILIEKFTVQAIFNEGILKFEVCTKVKGIKRIIRLPANVDILLEPSRCERLPQIMAITCELARKEGIDTVGCLGRYGTPSCEFSLEFKD